MHYLIDADDTRINIRQTPTTVLTDGDISTIENALANLAAQCDKDASEFDAEKRHPRMAAMMRESAAKCRATLKKIQGE